MKETTFHIYEEEYSRSTKEKIYCKLKKEIKRGRNRKR